MVARGIAWIIPVLMSTVYLAPPSSAARADTIIWLKPTSADTNNFARDDEAITPLLASLQSAAKAGDQDMAVVAVYPELGAVIVNSTIGSTSKVLSKLHELASKEVDPKARIAFKNADELIQGSSPDIQVSLFDTNCDDDTAASLTKADYQPLNIERVLQGAKPAAGTGNVWIVDSGLDSSVIDAKLVNVETDPKNNLLARNCTRADPSNAKKMCDATGYGRDPIGHGTMIAGIIGGQDGTVGTTAGMLGVASGVKIIPVKIFGNTGSADLSKGPMAGLNWVLANASPGDVVNISWGSYWIDDLLSGSNQSKNYLNTATDLSARVRAIADKGAFVVIAAGNADPQRHAAWLQFATPANTTGYVSKTSVAGYNGAIYAVAAVNSVPLMVGNIRTWLDVFWSVVLNPDEINPSKTRRRALSNFGLGRPDAPDKGILAEPGVDVEGLWPAKRDKSGMVFQTNTCSGTSFAAAHLSGILAQPGHPLHIGDKAPGGDPIDTNDYGFGTRVGTVQ